MAWPLDYIQKTRELFTREKFARAAVDVDRDTMVTYFVVPLTWAQRQRPDIPPDFVWSLTPSIDELCGGTIEERTLFAVSDTIYHLWQPYYILHEVQEYVSCVQQEPELILPETDTIADGCLLCSQAEWATVQEAFSEQKLRSQYIRCRHRYFADMLLFASRPESGCSKLAVQHYQQSLDYWKALDQQLANQASNN